MYKKIGGIHWLRIGKYRFAFCVAKPRDFNDILERPLNKRRKPLPEGQYMMHISPVIADYDRSYWIDETGEVVR